MKNSNIISIALLHYDKIDKVIVDNNIKYNKINENLIGYYDKKNSIWVWGYLYNKSNIKKVIDVIYEEELKNDDLVGKIVRETFLNSKFIISEYIQIEIILALASYYLKINKMIINKNDNQIYYFIE